MSAADFKQSGFIIFEIDRSQSGNTFQIDTMVPLQFLKRLLEFIDARTPSAAQPYIAKAGYQTKLFWACLEQQGYDYISIALFYTRHNIFGYIFDIVCILKDGQRTRIDQPGRQFRK